MKTDKIKISNPYFVTHPLLIIVNQYTFMQSLMWVTSGNNWGVSRIYIHAMEGVGSP